MPKSKKLGSKKHAGKVGKSALALKKRHEGERRSEPTSDDVTVDRRAGDDRRQADRRKSSTPVAVERRKLERRAKVSRRRQIDPTTCERDYSGEEVEFMTALDQYKRTSGRMFPTCSEILEVVRGLGYEKRPLAPTPLEDPAAFNLSVADVFCPVG